MTSAIFGLVTSQFLTSMASDSAQWSTGRIAASEGAVAVVAVGAGLGTLVVWYTSRRGDIDSVEGWRLAIKSGFRGDVVLTLLFMGAMAMLGQWVIVASVVAIFPLSFALSLALRHHDKKTRRSAGSGP